MPTTSTASSSASSSSPGSGPGASRKYLLLVVLALGVVVADQWSKLWVLRELTHAMDAAQSFPAQVRALYRAAPPEGWDRLHFRPRPGIEVSEKFFRLRYAENPGAAWGLFATLPERTRGPLFHVVSLGAVALILFYFSKLSASDRSERWARWGLPLVLGGALGNYIDRLARGFVVDFLEAHWFSGPQWPSFNVADTAICVGVGLLLVDAFVRRERPAGPVSQDGAGASTPGDSALPPAP